jgi:hypothetical protein
LDLTDSNIGDVGAKQLAQMLLSQNNTTLRIFAMWETELATLELQPLLRHCSHPNEPLALGNSQCGDTGVEVLLKAIASHHTLTYFQIHQNPIILHLRHVFGSSLLFLTGNDDFHGLNMTLQLSSWYNSTQDE